ncbi:helix-turn-helix domain-containing protein [Rathayibacter sp. AY1E1]|uniref:helix-turn-helix domain-containing protein n=1 Tax=Rathayibacter sp. AY1E1 TaxID=2080549 RepID=UPI000CE7777B|nr:helix-turn-helix domain-containing protein [Rathayibacter sp. AY1E1]PPH51716.1 PucR family transcriptional regulator [Rathayibacter sp. AY1E1]
MTLQDLADELAQALDRPVTIEDASSRVLAATRAREEAPHDGVFPVQDPRGRLATLLLPRERPAPLTPAEYSLIDAAVGAIRRLLGPSTRAGGSSRRADVLAALLAADGGTRRASFAEAVERRWLRRDAQTVVRAVRLTGPTGSLQRTALARRIDASAASSLTFLGDQEGVLFFVSVEAPEAAAEADDVLRAEARGRGSAVDAIGSARFDVRDDDLLPTAERAALAATIVGSLPDGRGRADIAELGAWVLLASIGADSSQLAMLSPAAATLLERGDEVQRRTVEAYLDVRGSVREACGLLHIHRTTLYYRLDNLPEAVREALDDGLARSTLHLCLKLMKFRDGLERRRAS